MVDALLGKKMGMTAIYDESGRLVPVTVIQLGPCKVVQVKKTEAQMGQLPAEAEDDAGKVGVVQKADGYCALQLGFEDRKPKNVKKPVLGHYGKAGIEPKRFLREVGWDGEDELEPGAVLTAEQFVDERRVDVLGVTKGRGFQGVVKRYGFAGGPKTHGQGDRHRAPGSIGQSASPSRVLKGTRMPGRMGGVRHTTRNLRVVRVDPERDAILVRGAVPGPRSGYVIVRRASSDAERAAVKEAREAALKEKEKAEKAEAEKQKAKE